MQAQLAWHASLEAARRKGQGLGISKGSNEDDVSSKLMVSLLNEPGLYKFTDGPIFGNLKFGAGGEDGEDEAKPTLLEIGAAIAELDQKMHAAMGTIREDQAGIMDHLWGSMMRRSVKARMQGMEDVVGDAKVVLDEQKLGDLSKGLMMVLGHFDASVILNIQDKVVALADLIKAVDKDHKQAAHFLLGKVNSHMPPTTHGSRTSAIRASLTLTMMLVDDQEDAVGTLEQLFQGVRGMVDDNARLCKEVESLSGGVTTQGMNILDGLGFASEAQVREVVERECPGGDAFEVFLDVVSLWCCGKRRHEPRRRTTQPPPGR